MSKGKKVAPLLENIGESTAACLVTMVQGNLLALGLGHWIIASQTGILAGVLASVALVLARTKNRLAISIILGVITGFVDYFVHDGMFGPEAAEAIVTGLGAAVLSYAFGGLLEFYRQRKKELHEVGG
ncbi:MAG: hypothetical protein AB8B95_01010 [Pseudohongiellaceae bacterium]